MAQASMQALESRTLFSKTVPLFQLIQNAYTEPFHTKIVDGKFVNKTVDNAHVTAKKGTPTAVTYDPTAERVHLDNRILFVTGTSKDDRISVLGNGKRLEVMVSTGKSHPKVFVGSYNAKGVDQVLVQGYRGDDTLTTNGSTQTLTNTTAVEGRRFIVDAKTEVPINPTDPAPGVYGGSIKTWLHRSADEIKTADKKDANVVLLGDSMLAYFAKTGAKYYRKTFGKNAVDFGLPGDTTSQLLYRIQSQGLLDGMSPKLAVLNIGTNNATLSTDADAIAAGINAVVAAIRAKLPKTKILILNPLPQHTKTGDATLEQVNQRLGKPVDGKTIKLLDDTAPFRDTHGHPEYYIFGNIHLAEPGYAEWGDLLRPTVQAMLAT